MVSVIKKYWLLAFIPILAVILRLIGIEKPSGFWHDEINTYNIASYGSLSDVLKYSMPRPLYFIVLRLWMDTFGHSDITLRLLSTLFGVINIPVMYFAGVELEKYFKGKDIKTISLIGIYAALLVAVNAFLIYYSQEVRQYALLGLLSTASAWSMLRIINNPVKSNFLIFVFVNALLIATHLISLLIIIPEVVVICLYLFLNNRKTFLTFLRLFSILVIPALIIFAILFRHFIEAMVYSKSIVLNGYSGIYNFDPQVLFVLLQNYFSPELVGLYNNPSFYLSALMSNINQDAIIFIIFPVIFCLWFMFMAIFSQKNLINPVFALLLPPFCFLIIVFFLSFLKTYVIVSRYTLICLPFLLLTVSAGIYLLKNKKLAYSVFSFFILINLLFTVFSPHSAAKMSRPDGQRRVAELFKDIPLKETDVVVFPRLEKMIDKYNTKKFKKYSMKKEFFYKRSMPALVGEKEAATISMSNSEEVLKKYLLSENPPPEFESYVKERFFNEIVESGYFILVHNNDVAYYTPENINKIVANDQLYQKNPVRFMLLSKISYDLFNVSKKYLTLTDVKQQKPWTVFIFRRSDRQYTPLTNKPGG